LNSDGAGRGAVDEEKELNTSRVIVASLALILILAGFLAGWALNHQRPERFTETNAPSKTAPSEQTAPRTPEPVGRIPSEDVPGAEISGLPRYPGSVRVEYERGQREGLKVVRARYLTRDGLDAVRGFYRGVFRTEGRKVANVEFSENRWTFLVVDGEREANIMIEPHGRDVTRVDIEVSEPLPKKEPVQEEKPQKREARPAPREPAPPQPATPTPTPAPQSAPPAPQSASPTPAPQPAPVPDYDDDDGGEDGDDLGDDGGGDD
jgi:hypothetical protein